MSSQKAPTAGEVNLLLTVLENNKSQMNVDWDAVAAAMNYKSANVASQRFGQVRRRLGWTQGVSLAKAVKIRAPSGGRVAKPRAAPKTLPKLEESDDEEGDQSNSQEDKGKDLMAPSDDEDEHEEMSMQDKVARGDFDSNSSGNGELPDGLVDLINRGTAEKELQNEIAQEASGPVSVEYDAYNSNVRFMGTMMPLPVTERISS